MRDKVLRLSALRILGSVKFLASLMNLCGRMSITLKSRDIRLRLILSLSAAERQVSSG